MHRTFIIILIGCFFLVSCKNGATQNNEEENRSSKGQTVVYNEKIQNVFFGVSFGASKNEVVEGLAKHNLYENEYSTKTRLSFEPRASLYSLPKEFFSFGGMNWHLLYVNMTNNCFRSIEFMDAYKAKESAMEDFEIVLSKVSSKYQMYEEPLDDTTSYKRFIGKTNDNCWVLVHCFSYESVSHQRWIGVKLAYGDDKYNGVSDEL